MAAYPPNRHHELRYILRTRARDITTLASYIWERTIRSCFAIFFTQYQNKKKITIYFRRIAILRYRFKSQFLAIKLKPLKATCQNFHQCGLSPWGTVQVGRAKFQVGHLRELPKKPIPIVVIGTEVFRNKLPNVCLSGIEYVTLGVFCCT